MREFTNFNRKPGRDFGNFYLRMEGATKSLQESYDHKVSDVEMIPKLEAALSGEPKNLFCHLVWS